MANVLVKRSHNLHYLAWKIHTRPEIIASLVARMNDSDGSLRRFYRRKDIPKSRGRKRIILSPQGRLRLVQDAIYQHLLRPQVCSRIAHGFVPGRSIITALLPHLKADFVFMADMKEAFRSVPKKVVMEIFAQLGFKGETLEWITRFTWEKDFGLPQGAPTSGMLFNLACEEYDRFLISRCRGLGYQVSRYADNIIISGRRPRTSSPEALDVDGRRLLYERFQFGGNWIRFGDLRNVKTVEISETRPARVLGGLLTGNDIRLSGKILRHLRIAVYNAILSGDFSLYFGIRGYLFQWYGGIPPQVAGSIEKARQRLEQAASW